MHTQLAPSSVGIASVILAIGVLATGCAIHETAGVGTAAVAAPSTPVNLTSHGVNEAGKSSSQILADAKRVALAARSVHLVGDLGDGRTLNLILTNAGETAGTVTEPGKGPLQLVVLNPATVYAATSKTGGRYVRLPQTDAAQISKLFNMRTLMTGTLTPNATSARQIVKTGVTTQDGQDQIGLKDTSSEGGMLYVADSAAAPYPLRIKGKGNLVFSDWNKAVTVKVPSASI